MTFSDTPVPARTIDSVTLEILVEASQDHLMITDVDGELLTASPSMHSVYGLSMEELRGTSLEVLEAQGIFTPSVTLKVLASHRPEQVLQTTATGRSVIAEGYPVFHDGRLVRVISRSRDINDLEEEYSRLQKQLEKQLEKGSIPTPVFDGIEASTPAMLKLVGLLSRVSGTQATVVLLGESGVGKTSLAKAIHLHGKTPEGPFIELNCASIPESLFESEMFGHVSGAFSGASSKGKPGLIEQADGGTLFLDEIGELGMAMQSKLLKVLQDNSVTRLGDIRSRRINFRLIVATHQDLAKRVQEGRFRLDLYYRLNVVPVRIPPLRERREEIPALVNRQRTKIKQEYGITLALSSEQWGFLMSHHWPGNVRELENYLERLGLTGSFDDYASFPNSYFHDTLPHSVYDRDRSSTVTASDCGLDNEIGVVNGMPSNTIDEKSTHPSELNLAHHIEETEKAVLRRACERARSTRAIAELLGISQPSVVRKMAKYKIQKHM